MSRRELPERLPPAEPPKEVGVSKRTLAIIGGATVGMTMFFIASEYMTGEDEVPASDQPAEQAPAQTPESTVVSDDPLAHVDAEQLVNSDYLVPAAVIGVVGLALYRAVKRYK